MSRIVRSTFRPSAGVTTTPDFDLSKIKSVYVSGPMTGLIDLNKPNFFHVASFIRAFGITVINPGETDPVQTEGESFVSFYAKCIMGDIMDISKVDAIVVLHNFDRSVGARCELHTAAGFGLPIIHFHDFVAALLAQA